MSRCAGLVLLVLLIAPRSADAQAFNVAFGPPGAVPSSSYAGVGLAGVWNEVDESPGLYTYVVDIAGDATSVRIRQIGGTEVRSTDDPGTSGDDALLMDHCLVTYTASLESCLYITGLSNGWYELVMYAWMPAEPTIFAYTSSDEEPGYPHKTVGGAWPGGHAAFVTYSRHTCLVTTGRLQAHSGIVPGADQLLGAALNGVQFRAISPPLVGDANCDGQVNVLDINPFVQALSDPGAYVAANPTCGLFNVDTNGDEQVDVLDINPFIALLTGA
ncbi:hypothetical protein RAS1_39350 [Phycisphaerae bacterium RAS1]|nr:hypothetical protein RAS1_39350 [Phycisphaerae bacterium RAS1]